LKARGLQTFLSVHLWPFHTGFMQSKHFIDCDSSPPHGHVSARAAAGTARLRPTAQAKVNAKKCVGFVILFAPSNGSARLSVE
jgi:hypothetical protein